MMIQPRTLRASASCHVDGRGDVVAGMRNKLQVVMSKCAVTGPCAMQGNAEPAG